MGDGRGTDVASASSEDSFRVPPRLDNSRIRPGPGALSADAFDPLRHEDWEQFWYSIDYYFQPINQEDVRFLRAIPLNAYGGARDPQLRVPLPPSGLDASKAEKGIKRERARGHGLPKEGGAGEVGGKSASSADSSSCDQVASAEVDAGVMSASLNSFPYTQRLVAAMLDVGAGNGGGTPAPAALPAKNSRLNGGMGATLWMGVGSEGEIRSYQKALEERVKKELVEYGLVDEKADDELQTVMREEQWKLRDAKTLNKMRKSALYTLIIGTELRAQAVKREVKRHQDQLEIAYLEGMVRNMKKNKKSRSKFQKLLLRMFGNYKEKDKQNDKIKKAAEAISNGRVVTNGRLLTNGDDKPRASIKKKKKKTEASLKTATAINSSSSRKGIP